MGKVIQFPERKPFDSRGVDLSACTEPELRPELVVTIDDLMETTEKLGGMPKREYSPLRWLYELPPLSLWKEPR